MRGLIPTFGFSLGTIFGIALFTFVSSVVSYQSEHCIKIQYGKRIAPKEQQPGTSKNVAPSEDAEREEEITNYADKHQWACSVVGIISPYPMSVGLMDHHEGFFVGLFTFALFGATALLWRSTEKLAALATGQAADTAKSIKEAARAADEMANVATGINESAPASRTVLETQKSFATSQLRAYISVDTGLAIRQDRAVRFEFRPNIFNNGQTPANRLKIISKIELQDGIIVPDNFDFKIPERDGVVTATLQPRQGKFHTSIFGRKTTFSELRDIARAKKVFHLWGRVSYEDVFGNPRYTNFSFAIMVPVNRRLPATWNLTSQHNEAT